LPVEIHFPSMLRHHIGNKTFIEANGNTVGECLAELAKRFPDLKGQLYEKNGKLKKVIEIYVNGVSAYPKELEKEVKDGDKIFITLMLAGG
jgi:molybdopterin converting factor small subunit